MFKAVLLEQWHSLSDPELEHSLITRSRGAEVSADESITACGCEEVDAAVPRLRPHKPETQLGAQPPLTRSLDIGVSADEQTLEPNFPTRKPQGAGARR